MNDLIDMEGAAEWAAASQPARSRARRARRRPQPVGYYSIPPSDQDKRLAVATVAVGAAALAGLLVWGAVERSAEREQELREERAPITVPYTPESQTSPRPERPPATIVVEDWPIYEDDPRFDCEDDGNLVCGPGVEEDEMGGPS